MKSTKDYKVNQSVSKTPVGGKKIPPKPVLPVPPPFVQQVAPKPQIEPITKPVQPVQKPAEKKINNPLNSALKKEIKIALPDPKDSTSTQIFTLTNNYREQNKIPALSYSPVLSKIAQKRAEEIANSQSFTHDGFKQTADQEGYKSWALGENLAQAYANNDLAFKAWQNSPGHNANLLNLAMKEIGIGYAIRKDGKVVLVQQFGNPK